MRPHPLRRRPPAFPRRGPHTYTLLVDGERFIPAMLKAIDGARSYVLLELYLANDGHCAQRFVDALCRAAQRGVGVYVLLDGYGASGLSSEQRQPLEAAGVRLALYNPVELKRLRLSLWRDHRKLLLVDGEVAFTGGMGLSDEFDPEAQATMSWHEVMVAIRGPCVDDWQTLFGRTWRRWSREPLPKPLPGGITAPAPKRDKPTLADGQVLGDHRQGGRAVMAAVISAINHSNSRVWLATGYFVPTLRLRRALVRAVRRGVDVRLLLPGPHSDHPAVWHAGRRFYGRLLRAGIGIYEYQPRFMHAKFVLCDDWASVGSSNLDHWTLRWNLEANQAVMSEVFAQQLAEVFETDFEQSTRWEARHWRERGRWQRFKERLFGGLDDWVTQMGDRYFVRMKDEG
ncbi:MAG: phosphatidylserine/phosphatidylglycerophosphate/cardiolipin synthase family protein [Thioalkalivibrio sp.]